MQGMNIEEILDMLDELLDKSWSLPLSGGRSVVDDEKIRELLDDIRLNLPSEIKQAKAIVADRADILATAKREADAVVRRAEDRARALIAQEEIIKQAQQKAAEILSQAQTKAKELRNASQDFSDDLLRQSEETLTKLLTEVRTTRQAMRSSLRK
ncbi:ATPase [Faecalicatena sp. BF-R-105]|nr:ATPase [Faecalicatena sp. BF-R-105]